MLAAWYKKFGSASEVLEVGELTEPIPGKGEVKIRIHSSAVNPSDVKKRLGSSPNLLDNGLVIPHSDGAGEIVDTMTIKFRGAGDYKNFSAFAISADWTLNTT